MLSELFEQLPEVGDPDKPKLVFFFDEAHLLFDDAPKALVDKVEQVARLIRSKGVGIYFITQSPDDVPEKILGQLGNRVQHALRAFTAKDQKALRLAAQTYRDNPRFSTEEAIREVGTGEAVTSFLEAKGIPGMVERTLIRPPSSLAGPIDPALRAQLIADLALQGQVRHGGRPRLGLRDAQGPRRPGGASGGRRGCEGRSREGPLGGAGRGVQQCPTLGWRQHGETRARAKARRPARRQRDRGLRQVLRPPAWHQIGAGAGAGGAGLALPGQMTTAASARIPIGPARLSA